MDKGIAIKAGIILGFFAVVLGLAFGCSSIKDKNVSPEISNREDVYLTVGDVEITRQDLWEMMKISDGLSYLEQYIEETIFLATEIDALTQPEIDKKIEYYRYGTNDADIILEIQEDAELVASLQEQFENSLIVLGFDPDDAADLEKFVQLEVAKEKVTREFIINAETDDPLEITTAAQENYYESFYKGDVCALDVRFSSETEALAVFELFSLVPNYNTGWGEYTGTDPIGDLSTGDFDETNTTQLDDAAVFAAFIEMYNYMNPLETPIAEDIDYDTFCTDYSDTNLFVYNDMTDGRASTDAYVTYANYLFETLDTEEAGKRYSYLLQTLGNFEVLTFKVSQDTPTAFEDLDQSVLDEMMVEILDASITADTIGYVMQTYWDAADYELFDPTFKLKNQFDGGEAFDNKGHETIVASVGDVDITADMLFNYMDESIGTYYTIELVKSEYLLNSAFYTDIYGTSYDYLDSNNEAMTEHRAELREMKGIFSSDGYASYGFSSATYNWEEFLVLAFGSLSEEDVIRDLFVVGNLQNNLIGEDSIAYANAADIIQTQIDEYFSLNIEHLLVYIDMDRDFTPDEYNDYVSELTGVDETDYNALFVSLENEIKDQLNDEKSFTDIVKEYNDSLVGDGTIWSDYKAYGFYLMTEDLSASASLSADTTDNFDPDFVVAVKNLYDEYVLAVDSSATDIDEMYDDELIQSDFGLHFLLATEGTDFEMPTAVFTDTDDEYTTGSEGTTVIPNAAQVALYINIKYSETLGEATDTILPSSVYDAIDTYYGATYESYFSTSGFSIAVVNHILDNNPLYQTDTVDRVNYLLEVLDVLYTATFPEGFIAPE